MFRMVNWMLDWMIKQLFCRYFAIYILFTLVVCSSDFHFILPSSPFAAGQNWIPLWIQPLQATKCIPASRAYNIEKRLQAERVKGNCTVTTAAVGVAWAPLLLQSYHANLVLTLHFSNSHKLCSVVWFIHCLVNDAHHLILRAPFIIPLDHQTNPKHRRSTHFPLWLYRWGVLCCVLIAIL